MSSTYSQEVLADGPAIYLRFDEAAPGTGAAADSSGNGRDGAYLGSPTSVPGLVAGDSDAAVAFDGTINQRVTTTYSPFAQGAERTFEILLQRAANADADTFLGSDNVPAFIARFDPTADTISIWTSSATSMQTWNGPFPVGDKLHIVFTFNGTTKAGELWVNGVSQGTQTFLSDFSATPGNLAVGFWGGGNDPYHGTIDELAVYEKILSAARIQAHATAATTIPNSGSSRRGGFILDSSGALVRGSGAGHMENGFLRDADGNLLFGSATPFVMENGFLRDATGALVESAGPGTMHNGFLRDATGALVTEDSASATGAHFERGFLVDANGALVTV